MATHLPIFFISQLINSLHLKTTHNHIFISVCHFKLHKNRQVPIISDCELKLIISQTISDFQWKQNFKEKEGGEA